MPVTQINSADVDAAVSSAPQRGDGAEVERTRKHKSIVIVGMLADQIYPSWRECNNIGISIECLAKPSGCAGD